MALSQFCWSLGPHQPLAVVGVGSKSLLAQISHLSRPMVRIVYRCFDYTYPDQPGMPTLGLAWAFRGCAVLSNHVPYFPIVKIPLGSVTLI